MNRVCFAFLLINGFAGRLSAFDDAPPVSDPPVTTATCFQRTTLRCPDVSEEFPKCNTVQCGINSPTFVWVDENDHSRGKKPQLPFTYDGSNCLGTPGEAQDKDVADGFQCHQDSYVQWPTTPAESGKGFIFKQGDASDKHCYDIIPCSNIPVTNNLMPKGRVYYQHEDGSEDPSRYEEFPYAHCIPDPSAPPNTIIPYKISYTKCNEDSVCDELYGPLPSPVPTETHE